MKLINLLRAVFLVIAIVLIIQINRKTDDQAKSIVEFKLEMLEKIRKDSLNTQDKLETVIDETSKFVDESSRIKRGTNYLLLLLVVVVITEIVFAIRTRKQQS